MAVDPAWAGGTENRNRAIDNNRTLTPALSHRMGEGEWGSRYWAICKQKVVEWFLKLVMTPALTCVLSPGRGFLPRPVSDSLNARSTNPAADFRPCSRSQHRPREREFLDGLLNTAARAERRTLPSGRGRRGGTSLSGNQFKSWSQGFIGSI